LHLRSKPILGGYPGGPIIQGQFRFTFGIEIKFHFWNRMGLKFNKGKPVMELSWNHPLLWHCRYWNWTWVWFQTHLRIRIRIRPNFEKENSVSIVGLKSFSLFKEAFSFLKKKLKLLCAFLLHFFFPSFHVKFFFMSSQISSFV